MYFFLLFYLPRPIFFCQYYESVFFFYYNLFSLLTYYKAMGSTVYSQKLTPHQFSETLPLMTSSGCKWKYNMRGVTVYWQQLVVLEKVQKLAEKRRKSYVTKVAFRSLGLASCLSLNGILDVGQGYTVVTKVLFRRERVKVPNNGANFL